VTDGMAHVAGVDVSAGHWIGGKRVHSNETFEDRSPVDGQWLADVAAGGADHVDAAVAEARRTFPAWAALRPKGRLPILKKLVDGIRARAEALAAVETLDKARCSPATSRAWCRVRRTTSSLSCERDRSLSGVSRASARRVFRALPDDGRCAGRPRLSSARHEHVELRKRNRHRSGARVVRSRGSRLTA